MDNPGFVYSQFKFIPQYEDEVLPTEEEFEALMYNLQDWTLVESVEMVDNEQEMYPGANQRFKYRFEPLKDALVAHLFSNGNDILYVVITT